MFCFLRTILLGIILSRTVLSGIIFPFVTVFFRTVLSGTLVCSKIEWLMFAPSVYRMNASKKEKKIQYQVKL